MYFLRKTYEFRAVISVQDRRNWASRSGWTEQAIMMQRKSCIYIRLHFGLKVMLGPILKSVFDEVSEVC